MTTQRIALVGAGLAGCECALQLARRGFAVTLFEQKPEAYSPAHSMPQLAELVCSNSLRSDELASALMAGADATRVPAGKALAVDRELFAGKVTELVEAEPNITLVRKAIADLDDPALEGFERVVISAGPLASESLSASIARAVGAEHLYFYAAIAPIVAADSILGLPLRRAGRGRLSELSHERGRVQGVLSGPARRREGRQPRI